MPKDPVPISPPVNSSSTIAWKNGRQSRSTKQGKSITPGPPTHKLLRSRFKTFTGYIFILLRYWSDLCIFLLYLDLLKAESDQFIMLTWSQSKFLFLPLKTWSFGPPARRAYASESQVRDRWLCLGVLCLKSQIPSTPPKERRAGKLQINPPQAGKSQITNHKFKTSSTRSAGACAACCYLPALLNKS